MPDSATTKKALAQAMKDLMCEKPFAKVSIGDICRKCEMNRKSFYYHFKDKYELVNWVFLSEFMGTIDNTKINDNWTFIECMCNYFYDNRAFYANALQTDGQNSFFDYFKEILVPMLSYQLGCMLEKNERGEFCAEFFTEAFVGSIIHWLISPNCMDAKKYTELLKYSMNGVIVKSQEK